MSHEKCAFITGGAEGIGAATCNLLAEAGFRIYFADIEEEKGNARKQQLKESGHDSTFFHIDVGKSEDWDSARKTLTSDGIKLDLLVNNAGIAEPSMPFPSEKPDMWIKVLRTNLSGAYYATNALFSLLKEGSSIINVASTRAHQSEPNTLAYSASKGGIISLTHSLAMTLSSRRIRVNSVSPGWIDTSSWKIPPVNDEHNDLDRLQHPSRRIGTPEDVANLIVFLASEKGSWINAQDIVIDGGMSKRMIYFDREVMEDALRQLTGLSDVSGMSLDQAFNRVGRT